MELIIRYFAKLVGFPLASDRPFARLQSREECMCVCARVCAFGSVSLIGSLLCCVVCGVGRVCECSRKRREECTGRSSGFVGGVRSYVCLLLPAVVGAPVGGVCWRTRCWVPIKTRSGSRRGPAEEDES